MIDSFDSHYLWNFLLTQKSSTEEMPYDIIEGIIEKSIATIQEKCMNARISNIALSINGKLILAQLYVERQNGFATTVLPEYGTTPTAYNVQIRFPFGLAMAYNTDDIMIPSGDFDKPLPPYQGTQRIQDDVMRDVKPEDIICGKNVTKTIEIIERNPYRQRVTLTNEQGQQVTFIVKNDKGKGYYKLQEDILEYDHLDDYNMRLKMNGVYPLFYRCHNSEALLCLHPYNGMTVLQAEPGLGRTVEAHEGQEERIQAYKTYCETLEEEITQTNAGQGWQAFSRTRHDPAYQLNLTIINNMPLLTNNNAPVTRLRPYQVQLFQECQNFIQDVATNGQHQKHASKIAMGVGSGKTFFTFTLLQYLKYKILQAPIAPSYCLAPDVAVADVTQQSIQRQGAITGMGAMAITSKEHMPNLNFMQLYKKMSNIAVKEAETAHRTLTHDLQNSIITFCRKRAIHPHQFINMIGEIDMNQKNTMLPSFKDSIDMKRLLLLIEGQKTMQEKTNMLDISALRTLRNTFEILKTTVNSQMRSCAGQTFQEHSATLNTGQSPFFKALCEAQTVPADDTLITLPYHQDIIFDKDSMKGRVPGDRFNLGTITPVILLQLLTPTDDRNVPIRMRIAEQTAQQFLGNIPNATLATIRDKIVRIACLSNNEAAVLLANAGGLGNTTSPLTLRTQIMKFLPDAVTVIQNIARNCKTGTAVQHYQCYSIIKPLFTSVPKAININEGNKDIPRAQQAFNQAILNHTLKMHVALMEDMHHQITQNIANYTKVSSLSLEEQKMLKKFNISGDTTIMEATHRLAGVASMNLTGHCQNTDSADDMTLLSTIVPIFTPEGIACFIEHLASLEGQSVIHFKKQHGIFTMHSDDRQKITQQDIIARLQQFLNGIAIADEIHKEEFAFLYDEYHPIYQRITAVTQRFLNQPFKAVLPHRIGMSGTVNHVAEAAFGCNTLFSLSTQDMMKEKIMKNVSITSKSLAHDNVLRYAQRVVIDYFSSTCSVSLPHGVMIEQWRVSKGIIFTQNVTLQNNIDLCFNLLLRTHGLSEQESQLQRTLLQAINQDHYEKCRIANAKLSGEMALSETERQSIEQYNQASHIAPIQWDANGKITHRRKPIKFSELTSETLNNQLKDGFSNHLFAVYFTYILSKSTSPQEFSDIVSLQNMLFEQGLTLIEACRCQHPAISRMLALMAAVNPNNIDVDSVTSFMQEHVKHHAHQQWLINTIMVYKNKHEECIPIIKQYAASKNCQVITDNRASFESGDTMILLGGPSEQTGYSHEPVGMVVNVPVIEPVVDFSQPFTSDDIPQLFAFLNTIVKETWSYHEKNQAGGRCLRALKGSAVYLEYLSSINEWLKDKPKNSPLQALQVETSFGDIFTTDSEAAQQACAAITFNRTAIETLNKHDFSSFAVFKATVHYVFAQQNTQAQFACYDDRLPFLWCLRYNPELAAQFFNTQDIFLFNALKTQAPAAPIIPLTATPIIPLTATPIIPLTATPIIPLTATPIIPLTATPIIPLTATPIITTTTNIPLSTPIQPMPSHDKPMYQWSGYNLLTFWFLNFITFGMALVYYTYDHGSHNILQNPSAFTMILLISSSTVFTLNLGLLLALCYWLWINPKPIADEHSERALIS
jgi:hypothetical protein